MTFTRDFRNRLRRERRKLGFDQGTLKAFRDAVIEDSKIYEDKIIRRKIYKKQNDCTLGKTNMFRL